MGNLIFLKSESVAQRYSVKKVFLEILQNSQENTFAGVSFCFLVRIFRYSDWIRRETPYLFVFSPNTGKYRPEKNSVFGHFSGGNLPWVTTHDNFYLNLVTFIFVLVTLCLIQLEIFNSFYSNRKSTVSLKNLFLFSYLKSIFPKIDVT